MSQVSFEQLKKMVEQDDVRVLAEHAVSLNKFADARDVNGRGLFHAAAHARAGDSMSWLIDQKIGSVDAPDNQGETALMRTAWLGYQSGVDLLLEAGASIEARSLNGGTALHYAYAGGTNAKSVIPALVAAGADIAAQDNDGNPPEQWAQQAVSRERGQALADRMKQKATRGTLSINRPKV